MVHELMTPAGLLLRRDAVEHGYDDNCLLRLTRSEVIDRIRQGAYADSRVWRQLDSRGRHSLLTDAVVAQYDEDSIAVSHDSAVLRHGGPDWGLELTDVHATHLDEGGGRRSAKLIHHRGSCHVNDVTRLRGHWITSPARTVVDVTLLRGIEAGLVVADDFIRRGLTTTEELWQVYQQMKDWSGALKVQIVIRLATGRSESVGESLGYLMFRNLSLPKPVQQFEVHDANGRLIGRTDWAWPEYGVLGEFDGAGKYVRYLRPNETIADAVMREKRREDMLREVTGWRFIRLIWADLFRPAVTGRRVHDVLFPAAPLPAYPRPA